MDFDNWSLNNPFHLDNFDCFNWSLNKLLHLNDLDDFDWPLNNPFNFNDLLDYDLDISCDCLDDFNWPLHDLLDLLVDNYFDWHFLDDLDLLDLDYLDWLLDDSVLVDNLLNDYLDWLFNDSILEDNSFDNLLNLLDSDSLNSPLDDLLYYDDRRYFDDFLNDLFDLDNSYNIYWLFNYLLDNLNLLDVNIDWLLDNLLHDLDLCFDDGLFDDPLDLLDDFIRLSHDLLDVSKYFLDNFCWLGVSLSSNGGSRLIHFSALILLCDGGLSFNGPCKLWSNELPDHLLLHLDLSALVFNTLLHSFAVSNQAEWNRVGEILQ